MSKYEKLAVCHTINPNSKTSGLFKHPLPTNLIQCRIFSYISVTITIVFEIEYFGFQKCFISSCGNFPGRLSNFIFSYEIYLLTIHYCNKIANYEIEKLSFKLYMRSSYTITVMAATTAIFNTEQEHNSINE
jgi:hypothetical protein